MKKKILERFLRFFARAVLKKYKPKIVAITGSAGKSTTKELIYLILKTRYTVFRSYASLNNEIGVPLTVFLIDWRPGNSLKNWLKVFLRASKLILINQPYPEILVIETGVECPGDMDYLLTFIKPYIGVFTVVGDKPAHLQFFNSVEEVIKEKGKLIETLPKDGLAVLNRDDQRIFSFKEKIKAKAVGFSKIVNADCQIKSVSLENGLKIELVLQNHNLTIFLPHSINESVALNLAASLLVGSFLEISIEQMKAAVEKFEDLPGRMKYFKISLSQSLSSPREVRISPHLSSPPESAYIIDDSYNASPVSYKKLIETVTKLQGRKLGVLADVLEADSMAKEIHQEIALLADGVFSHIALIGSRMKLFALPVFKQSAVSVFEPYDVEAVYLFLEENIMPGDTIIFKGARAFHLEKIIEKFKENNVELDLVKCYCDYKPGIHKIEYKTST
jgi:UDP-N-acetylmuramoyl-tripeptide--D-alanyl-D-alanine ligase